MSDLWEGIVAHPNLVNFKVENYSVAGISKVSNGFADTRKTATEADANTASQLLLVNYEFSEVSIEAHAQLGADMVANFAPGKINGLIGKTFIGHVDTGIFGGVYYFLDQASVDAHIASDLWKGIAPISSISNGLPTM